MYQMKHVKLLNSLVTHCVWLSDDLFFKWLNWHVPCVKVEWFQIWSGNLNVSNKENNSRHLPFMIHLVIPAFSRKTFQYLLKNTLFICTKPGSQSSSYILYSIQIISWNMIGVSSRCAIRFKKFNLMLKNDKKTFSIRLKYYALAK